MQCRGLAFAAGAGHDMAGSRSATVPTDVECRGTRAATGPFKAPSIAPRPKVAPPTNAEAKPEVLIDVPLATEASAAFATCNYAANTLEPPTMPRYHQPDLFSLALNLSFLFLVVFWMPLAEVNKEFYMLSDG